MSENEPLVDRSRSSVTVKQSHKLTVRELFTKLESTPDGLSTASAKDKREKLGVNFINPPLSAPAWLCCLLPCLLNTPSMRKYNEIVPDFGNVKRNGKWIRLDSVSIVPGDIMRISVGERVAADIRILTAKDCKFDGSDIIGNVSNIAGDPDRESEEYLDSPNVAFFGYLCSSGECTGVAVDTGANTILARLINKKAWPPSE